jgi:hypothetical protein
MGPVPVIYSLLSSSGKRLARFEANYKIAIAPGFDLVPVTRYVVHPDAIAPER